MEMSGSGSREVKYKGIEIELKTDKAVDKNQLEEAVLQQLVKCNSFEVPKELLEQEVSMLILELNHRMQYENLASGKYVGMDPEEIKNLYIGIEEEAQKQIKLELILDSVIKTEGLVATREELEKEAMDIAGRQQIPEEMVKGFFGEDMKLLEKDVLVKKAIGFVCMNAVIKV